MTTSPGAFIHATPDGDEPQIDDTFELRRLMAHHGAMQDAPQTVMNFFAEWLTWSVRLATLALCIQLLHRLHPQALTRSRAAMWSKLHLSRALDCAAARPKAFACFPVLLLMSPPVLLAPFVRLLRLTWRLLLRPLLGMLLWLLDQPGPLVLRLAKAGAANAIGRLKASLLACAATPERVALLSLAVAVAALLTRRVEWPARLRAQLLRRARSLLATAMASIAAIATAALPATARQTMPPTPPLPPPPPPPPPTEFSCPITYLTMADPVVAADGRSYERAAIQQWLDTRESARASKPAD